MVFFSNKKKLERARIEQQRLENEIHFANRRRQQQEDEQRHRLEAQRQEQTRLELQIARDRERAKQEKLEIARREEERQRKVAEKQRAEKERIDRDRRLQQEKLRRLKEASPETLRVLRELIRNRYELDVGIWGLRSARRPDRWIVLDMMDKSDAIMQEIHAMIGAWGDNRDKAWSDEEWEKVESIRKRLQNGGYQTWADNPPWGAK